MAHVFNTIKLGLNECIGNIQREQRIEYIKRLIDIFNFFRKFYELIASSFALKM